MWLFICEASYKVVHASVLVCLYGTVILFAKCRFTFIYRCASSVLFSLWFLCSFIVFMDEYDCIIDEEPVLRKPGKNIFCNKGCNKLTAGFKMCEQK